VTGAEVLKVVRQFVYEMGAAESTVELEVEELDRVASFRLRLPTFDRTRGARQSQTLVAGTLEDLMNLFLDELQARMPSWLEDEAADTAKALAEDAAYDAWRDRQLDEEHVR
jgi:hypothetical protein